MLKSSFRDFTKSALLPRIKCRTFSTQGTSAQNRIKVVSSDGYFMSGNFTKGLQNRQLLNNTTPVLSTCGFLTSKNHGVRNFSSGSVAETFETLSKYLEGTPVDWVQNLLLWIHSTTGLPWWATIIVNTLALRASFILPLSLYQMNVAARLQNVQTEVAGFAWKLKQKNDREAQEHRWSESLARRKYHRSLKKEMQKLYIRDNCHPLKVFSLSVIYLAIFISQTIAIRNLCYMLPASNTFAELKQIELSVGGFGWIKNLVAVDGYFILPIFLGALSFAMLETRNLLKTGESPIKWLRIFQKGTIVVFPIISIAISANMPAAVVLCWATNSTFAFLEMLLFTAPKMRQLVGIPKTINEHNQPFAILFERIRAKYRLPLKVKGTS